MKGLLALAVLITIFFSVPNVVVAENITEHSFVHLSGYMEDQKIYQTESGFAGSKLVVGTRGSGTMSRTQTMYETDNSIEFNEWGVFDYKPYTATATESDLCNALCAKNYDVGSVMSESYSDLQYLVKDTKVYQTSNVSIYQIGSMGRGTAKVGATVQPTSTSVAMMTYGGTYIGDFNIRQEIGVDTDGQFYLTCP
jgi:hypothetical protein